MNIETLNILTALKPCKRREYLEINNFENIDDILSEFIAHTKQTIKNTYITPKAQKAFSFVDKLQTFQSVNFDTSNEPLPTFQYTNEWVGKTNIIAPITEPIIKYIDDPEPVINNNYHIDMHNGVYRIIINETTTIELDTDEKTFKIIDKNKVIISIKT
jgi:hypothetical protein